MHADNICVVESSKSSSVMLPVHTDNFESLSVAHVLNMKLTHYIDAHTYIVALSNFFVTST